MYKKTVDWTVDDYSQAMANAINQNANRRFLRQNNNTIKFNGFWRNGDKQNICVWLNSATWHDAKTGDGGGCKDFAKTAFNLSLAEFMELYSFKTAIKKPGFSAPSKIKTISKNESYKVNDIWQQLCSNDLNRNSHANHWLENQRGFIDPLENIGSGFANFYDSDLKLFNPEHHNFLKNRLSLGLQLLAPIREFGSDKVVNLFFRSIEDTSKEQKSRLLPNSGGWGEEKSGPRAFGFPHLINDFSTVILCEGMADYFAVECLIGPSSNHLALGVPSASSFPKWATFLSQIDFLGNLVLLYQLDTDQTGKVSSQAVGQNKVLEALKILLSNKKHAALFDWPYFLTQTKPQKIPKDIADIFLVSKNLENLSSAFEESLKRTVGHGHH